MFWGFISPGWNPGLCGLSCSPAVPTGLSAHECGTTRSSGHHLAWSGSQHLARPSPPAPVLQPPPCHKSSPPSCPSLPLWLVCMNVSSLTPWLLDFHTVIFSVNSGWFLFLNLLLSFFRLCREAQCVYLLLHLGWKSRWDFSLIFTVGKWWSS